VLHDLIRTLPLALLVCFLPGWFWTRLLSTSADRIEQAAYSIALAITLVPTAALVLARLLGTGVTFPVAVAAPLLVFTSGLLAYLRFGPAKGPVAPIVPPPAPLGTPALALLVAALALALAAFFNLVSGAWATVLVAPLVFLVGIVHLLTSPQHGSPPVDERYPAVRYAVVSVVLLLVLLRGYLGPVLRGRQQVDDPHEEHQRRDEDRSPRAGD